MARYIDADLLMPNAEHKGRYDVVSAYDIANTPTADVRENVRGKWIMDENPHDGDCRCSHCGIVIDQMNERNHGLLNALTGGKWWTFYKFCPNCGADMKILEGDIDG